MASPVFGLPGFGGGGGTVDQTARDMAQQALDAIGDLADAQEAGFGTLAERVTAIENYTPPENPDDLTADDIRDIVFNVISETGTVHEVDLASGDETISAAEYTAADSFRIKNATQAGRKVQLDGDCIGTKPFRTDRTSTKEVQIKDVGKTFKIAARTGLVVVQKQAVAGDALQLYVTQSAPTLSDVREDVGMREQVVSDSSGTIEINCLNGLRVHCVLTGSDRTLANPTNPFDGATLKIRFVQGSGGGHAVAALGNKILPAGRTLWSHTADEGAIDEVVGVYSKTDDVWTFALGAADVGSVES